MAHLTRPLALSVLTLALVACSGQPREAQAPLTSQAVFSTFYNPVKTLWTDGSGNPVSLESPDPWLTSYGGYYYLTTTTVSNIQIRRARSLGELTNAPDTVVWTDSTPSRCCNMYAAEFHRLTGPNGTRWYLYYTAGDATSDSSHRMYVLESSGDDPMGPYSFKAKLETGTSGFYSIDGTVFRNEADGKLYFLWSDGGLLIASMSDPWTLSSAPVRVANASYDWEKVNNFGINEAPEILQRNGKIHVVYSAAPCNTPEYKLGLLTVPAGADLLSTGTWANAKNPSPVFQSSAANSVYGPGHNGFFKSPDGKEDWIVYHATATNVGGCGGPRTTRAQKFTWNSDGTPNFGTPVGLGTAITLPSGDPGGVDNLLANADFEGGMNSWGTWPGRNGTDADADFTEAGGFNGNTRLTHYKSAAYEVYTSQTVNVPNGTYAVEAWVVSGGGQKDAFLSAKNYGGSERTASIRDVAAGWPKWKKLTISGVGVTNGQITVGVYSNANAGNWLSVDRVRLYRQ